MITLKRSVLSPVAAIKTLEKGRQGYWISTADRERGEKKMKGISYRYGWERRRDVSIKTTLVS